MHLVQHGVAFKVVQTYLGHKDAASTEVYTKVFALAVGAQYGVRFSMAIREARELIGGEITMCNVTRGLAKSASTANGEF